jgi:transposase
MAPPSKPTSSRFWFPNSREATASSWTISAATRAPPFAAPSKPPGAKLLYLPPYSPDFNPIENAFAKLKALLRKAAERTIDRLWTKIAELLRAFTPAECANYFAAAGYDAT